MSVENSLLASISRYGDGPMSKINYEENVCYGFATPEWRGSQLGSQGPNCLNLLSFGSGGGTRTPDPQDYDS